MTPGLETSTTPTENYTDRELRGWYLFWKKEVDVAWSWNQPTAKAKLAYIAEELTRRGVCFEDLK